MSLFSDESTQQTEQIELPASFDAARAQTGSGAPVGGSPSAAPTSNSLSSELTIGAEDVGDRPEPIKVNLVGKQYEVIPPKMNMTLQLMRKATSVTSKGDTASEADALQALDGVDHWLSIAFGEKQTAAIQTRLQDPQDALDFKHLMSLMEALMERQNNLPPT